MILRYRHLLAGLGLVALTFGVACDDGGGGSGSGVSLGSDESDLGKGGAAGQSGEAPDDESDAAASMTYGGGNTFNSCTTYFGDPGGSKTVCHYPGPDSCLVTQSGDTRCIDCTYPDGSGKGICFGDPNDPLLDPLSGRPDDLPPPGECASSNLNIGGPPAPCTICTHEDGSATRTCEFGAATCAQASSPSDDPDDRTACVVCIVPESAALLFCDPWRGPVAL